MALRLTAEGRKYLEEGLPEANLVKDLQKLGGKAPIGKAKGDNFSIALQWAKKNNWVKVESGSLILLEKSPKSPIPKALQDVSENRQIQQEMEKLLVFRKLAEETREDALARAEKQLSAGANDLTPELVKSGLWKKAKLKPYNVAATESMHIGKRHPYSQFLQKAREKLVSLGFEEMRGPLVELEFWNFDALFQAQNHPARDWTDTHSLKGSPEGTLPDKKIVSQVAQAHENGWKTGSTGWGYKWDPRKAAKLMPRAHGTATSARTLAAGPKMPGKYFSISRCYRPDVIDATHGVEFNQFEGIVLGEGLNFRDLVSLLKTFAREIAGAEKIKLLPDYYPFTEPSVQMSAKHPELGWVELGGAGIFREELTKPLDVDVPVIAWGLGTDRLAMFKLGINDIRNLFSQNIDWLRKQVVL